MGDEIPSRSTMQPASSTTTVQAVEQPSAWSPAPWFPLVAATLAGAAVAVAPLLAAPGLTVGAVLAAVVSGAATGLMGYLGIKSGGTAPRR